jgi:hypothetical protein
MERTGESMILKMEQSKHTIKIAEERMSRAWGPVEEEELTSVSSESWRGERNGTGKILEEITAKNNNKVN